MPAPHVTKVFAAKDAKFYPLTSDTGAAPVYGTGIDVPGLKTLTISGDVNNVELRGDNTLLDSQSTLTNISVEMEFAKQSLDILAALTTATVADSGVAPNEISTWTLLGTSGLSYVGISAVAVGADPIGGDTTFSIYKATLSGFPEMGLAEEDYQTISLELAAMPTLSNQKWIGTAIRNTAAALAAPA